MHPRLRLLGLVTATLLLYVSSPLPSLYSLLPAQAQTPTPQDRRAEAIKLNEQGLQLESRGQFREALEKFQQALGIVREIRERQGEGNILSNIGQVYRNLGQYPKALEFYQQALAISKEVRDRSGEGNTLNNIGAVYLGLGQYPKALNFHQQALAIFKEVENRSDEGSTLDNIGQVYYNLGQYPKALESFRQALVIRKELGNRPGEGNTLNNIGVVYFGLGQYPKALESFRQALAIAKEVGNRPGEGATLNNIGFVYLNLGQYPKALEFYQQALVIRKEVGDRPGEGATLNNIGGVYYKLRQYPKALEFCQQALAILKGVGNRPGEGTSLTNIGFVYNGLGNYPDAEKALFLAVEILESLRPGLTDDNKVSIFETQADTYRFLQQALIAQNKDNTALEVAERGRARAFVELLTSQLSQSPNVESAIKPPTIGQIQQIAKAQNAALVEYSINKNEFKVQDKPQVKESELFIWVVKPTGEVAFRQVDLKPLWQEQNTSLEALVTTSRDSIGVRGRGSVKVAFAPGTGQAEQLQQLHKLLIEPISDLLPTDPNARVIFAPQGSLFLVPFPALQDASGKYLIEKHTILTTPSIQVLQLTHQQGQKARPAAGSDVLVVGNPTMPRVTVKVGEPPEQLSDLPGAKQEAIDIAELLNTQALTGNQATKAAVMPQLPKARLIHLATHGLLDDFKGLGVPGAIALAPAGKDDGLLTASEILDLKLKAELVVLSACDTGRGRITGDGVIGLSRSLISAGVPSVVVSLWSVPDAPTADLMTEFYRNFQEGKLDKAQALRQAMLKTMEQHRDPRDWAAFTLIGEAE